MDLQQILAALLNPNGMQQNQLSAVGAPAQVGDHANPAMLPGFQNALQAPEQALAAPQAPQGQPMPQGAPEPSGGGIGGLLSGLFQGPKAREKNYTIGWLQKQGMDEGTATLLAGSKPALQQYLLQRQKPIEINGRLVDPNTYQVIADFSDKTVKGKKRDLTPEEVAQRGYPAGSYQVDTETGDVSTVGGAREQDPTFGREKDIRQEYENSPIVKNYQIVRDNYERIRQGAQLGTGSGDLAIVFGYMKMLDPTSVVREGEQASAMNAGGVPANVRNLYNRVINGDKLDGSVRDQFVTSASTIYGESAKNLGDLNQRYSDIATNWKLDPTRVIQPPEQYDPLAPPPVQQGGDLPLPPQDTPPVGAPGGPAAVTPEGQRVIKQMTNPAPVKDWQEWFKRK